MTSHGLLRNVCLSLLLRSVTISFTLPFVSSLPSNLNLCTVRRLPTSPSPNAHFLRGTRLSVLVLLHALVWDQAKQHVLKQGGTRRGRSLEMTSLGRASAIRWLCFADEIFSFVRRGKTVSEGEEKFCVRLSAEVCCC